MTGYLDRLSAGVAGTILFHVKIQRVDREEALGFPHLKTLRVTVTEKVYRHGLTENDRD